MGRRLDLAWIGVSWVGGSKYHEYRVQYTMGRGARYTVGSEVDTPWIGVDIPWLGVDIP